MKKVLIFTNYLNSKSETFISDEIAFLSRQCDIKLDILHYGRTSGRDNEYGLGMPATLWKRWIRAPLKFNMSIWRSLIFRSGRNGALSYLIHFFRAHRYDVIYSHFGTNGKLICELQDLYCIPVSTQVVIRFHGMDMNFVKYPVGFYNVVTKKNINVIAGSEFAIRNLCKYGFENSQILKFPVGVQSYNIIDNLDLQDAPAVFCLVSVGRLVRLKGHIQSIMIMNELKKLGINFKYTIVGSGPLRNELDELIARFHLSDQVHIIDKMDHSDVLTLLRKSHLYLYPGVVDQAGRQETQGLANLEAMASGLLVLASDVGGVSDYIKIDETGYLCEPGNIQQFVHKIQWIIKNFRTDEVLNVRRNAVEKVRHGYCQGDLNAKLLNLLLAPQFYAN